MLEFFFGGNCIIFLVRLYSIVLFLNLVQKIMTLIVSQISKLTQTMTRTEAIYMTENNIKGFRKSYEQ